MFFHKKLTKWEGKGGGAIEGIEGIVAIVAIEVIVAIEAFFSRRGRLRTRTETL